MTVIRSTVLIERSKDEVFDFLSDMRNELKWNPGCESMEKLTDGPLTVGTKYRAKWKQTRRPLEVTCVAVDPPNSWAYHNGGPLEVTFTARLTEQSSATRLEVDFDATAHGLFKLIFPIFVRVMRRQERQNMENIKTSLEGGVDRAPA